MVDRTISLFIYRQAFDGSYMYNRAAAASMIMFLFITALSAIVFYLMRDKYAIAQAKAIKKLEKERRRAEKAAKGVA